MNVLVKQSGFSLIELMVTLAIIGVMAAWAAPSIQQGMARMQVKNTAAALRDSLVNARSIAGELVVPVQVRPVLAAPTDWNAGVVNDKSTATVTSTNVAGVSAADVQLIKSGKASWYTAIIGVGGAVRVRDITPISDGIKVKVLPSTAVGNLGFEYSGRRVDGLGVLQFEICSPNTNFRQIVTVQVHGLTSVHTPPAPPTGVIPC